MSNRYTDKQALRDWLAYRWGRYATDAERHAYSLAARRPLAADPKWVGSPLARQVEAEWAQADEATRRAVEEGAESIRKRAIDRLVHEFHTVQGITGNCPRCGKVLRTPLAKQCRWCRHDWHSP